MASLDKSRDTQSRKQVEIVRWFFLTEPSTYLYIRDYFSNSEKGTELKNAKRWILVLKIDVHPQ